MTLDEAIRRVQFAYPRIYLACHSHHQNARTTPDGLSQRDASILAHLSAKTPVLQADLTRHLGLAKSTVSEALRGLVDCGYVERIPVGDGREQPLRLTDRGVEAMSDSSVLESSRLARVLSQLAEPDRERAIAGLELLAQAALDAKESSEEACA